jgi:hypothetical protein
MNCFLGKIGCYRKFIPDIAHIAASLHKVSNKTRTKRYEFYWHAEKQAVFEYSNKILNTALLFLHFSDHSLPFILSTDASLTRIAFVLKQNNSTGLKICYYKSRILSNSERQYSFKKHGAPSICWCLDRLLSCIAGPVSLLKLLINRFRTCIKVYVLQEKDRQLAFKVARSNSLAITI